MKVMFHNQIARAKEKKKKGWKNKSYSIIWMLKQVSEKIGNKSIMDNQDGFQILIRKLFSINLHLLFTVTRILIRQEVNFATVITCTLIT